AIRTQLHASWQHSARNVPLVWRNAALSCELELVRLAQECSVRRRTDDLQWIGRPALLGGQSEGSQENKNEGSVHLKLLQQIAQLNDVRFALSYRSENRFAIRGP